MARSLWTVGARVAVLEVAIPIGAAFAAGAVAASLTPPEWRAPGQPWLTGHAKNIEHAAVGAGLLVGGATRWLVQSRGGLILAGVLAAIGMGLVATSGPAFLLWSGPGILLAVSLATSLSDRWFAGPDTPEDRTPSPQTPSRHLRPWVAALLAGGLAGAVGALSMGPRAIDVFHHGEVLSSAVDLVGGGRPFETFLWPHGLHDTGLAALWILITGKIGSSPVVLARATCAGLGILTAYLLAHRLTRSSGQALAVCAALALAALITDPSGEPELLSIYHLGVLFFVVLGFTVLTSARAHREFLAGVCLGFGYLFRLEAGIFGAAAAVAVIAFEAVSGSGDSYWGRFRSGGKRLLAFGSGVAVCLVAWRAAFGWPGAAWFHYTLLDLPRYHRDAVGATASWGGDLAFADGPATIQGRVLLAWLIFVLLLIVQAVAAVLPGRTAGAREGERKAQVLFLSVFALLATRSALDRTDTQHVVQWTVLPVLGILLVAATRIGDQRHWPPVASMALLFPCVLLLSFIRLEARPAIRGEVEAHGLTSRWRSFGEHLSPNPPVGPCEDRMFTPAESRLPSNRRFIDDTCRFQRLLEERGVTRLAITHSAPWYQVRFHLPLLTRYYAVSRAYTPLQQLELVADLRKGRPQALLRAQGHRAVFAFGIPDALRAPVVEGYLRERRKGTPPISTGLGDVFLWNETRPCPSRMPGGEESQGIRITPAPVSYQLATGFVFAQGTAMDSDGQALTSLAVEVSPSLVGPHLEYGLSRRPLRRPGTRAGPGFAPTGWELSARRSPAPHGLGGQDSVEFVGVSANGGTARVRLDLSSARVLAPLTGPEWEMLQATVGKAEDLGRADRADACQSARPSGCGCEQSQ